MPKPLNNELKIGELPILKIVAINCLRFHENPDDFRREKLVARLKQEKILKNPPIVARCDGHSEYIILDGANRVTAIKDCGLKHIVVQVVDIDDKLLIIDTWHHAIEKLDRKFFKTKIAAMDGIRCFDHAEDRVENERNGAILTDEHKRLCTLIFSDGRLCTVGSDGDLKEQVSQLSRLTELYLHDDIYDRVSYINLEHLKRHYPDFKTLISFRGFDKSELLELALQGIKIPSGITRVFLPKRALGLNMELEFLKADHPLDKKNKELDAMILTMVRNKSIRFYREPTFAFDE